MTAPVLRSRGAQATKPLDMRRLSLEQLAALPDEAAIEAVKRGLPARLAREMSRRLGLPLEALAGPLQLASRTLHRRVQEGVLAQAESERLLALARIYFRAATVLGEEAKAKRWIKSRPAALAGKTPWECMETWLGIRQVETVLGRIEGGVYS